jgi:hypothetical protein
MSATQCACSEAPTGSGQAASHGSVIYRAHQQTQRTSPEIQPDCPLSLGLLQTSYLPESLHLISHRVIMPPGSSTNDDGTQGYLSGAAARTPVVQYLPLRRALTNNVRIRCTWRCQAHLAMPDAPGDPQVRLFETGRTCHSQGAPVDCRCTSITPGAPVKIAGAPGDARCALGMTGAPGIRAFKTGRTCHSEGAHVDRRWISITTGASLEYTRGTMGGGRAWVSGSLPPLSECGCSSRRRKTVPPSGCRVAVFPWLLGVCPFR